MTEPTPAPSFPVATAYGPAEIALWDRDRALIHAEALTVGRIAYEVRFHLKRDHAGRFADDGLYLYRVGDRWKPGTDHARRALVEELRRVVNAFAAAHPEALDDAERADASREAERLEHEAERLERDAAAKRAGAATLRDALVSGGGEPTIAA